MKKALGLVLCITFLLRACILVNGANTKQSKTPFTEESFLEYIEMHDTGLTEKDFKDAGVVIEAFLDYIDSTIETVNPQELEESFRNYLDYLERMGDGVEEDIEMAPYLVRELQYVESTDEEYQDFITRYFQAIHIDAKFYTKKEDGVVAYEAAAEQIYRLYCFCQTNKSQELRMELSHAHYMIVLQGREAFMYEWRDIFYSKSGKYLMYLSDQYGYPFEERLHIIKAFCEMKDQR